VQDDMALVVGLCTIELQVPGSTSLKDKRRVIRSVRDRVRNAFNVSVAEVDHHDSRQFATIAIACVSSSGSYAHGLLEKAVGTLESGRYGLVLLDYEIEML
jgi:uncharacterized protein YlxP (DUF503 family)